VAKPYFLIDCVADGEAITEIDPALLVFYQRPSCFRGAGPRTRERLEKLNPEFVDRHRPADDHAWL